MTTRNHKLASGAATIALAAASGLALAASPAADPLKVHKAEAAAGLPVSVEQVRAEGRWS